MRLKYIEYLNLKIYASKKNFAINPSQNTCPLIKHFQSVILYTSKAVLEDVCSDTITAALMSQFNSKHLPLTVILTCGRTRRHTVHIW